MSVNPFDFLGTAVVAKVAADAWTTAMVALFSGGLWFLEQVLVLVDAISTPDLRADGPAADVYPYTAWVGVTLLGVLVLVQLGVAAFRRDGESLARAVIGTGQFLVVWAVWVSYGVAVVAATSALARAFLRSLLGIETWAAWEPVGIIVPEDITDATLATVLGFMGLLLWLAAIGHFLVMLARAAALLVLVVTAPISAAGLATGFGRAWFWKSLRWFHAAAFTPVLMALVLGIGVRLTGGVVTGAADSLAATIGTAVPGVFLICIACFSPLVLLKLLAFLDPGTSSGAAMRQGLAATGGLQGLLSGSTGPATTSAASSTDGRGRSQAEVSAQSDTSARVARSTGALAAAVGGTLGPAGAAAGTAASLAVGAITTMGTRGAVVGADLVGQMGVGDSGYVPDVERRRPARTRPGTPDEDDQTDEGHTGGGDHRPGSPAPPRYPAPPPASPPASPPSFPPRNGTPTPPPAPSGLPASTAPPPATPNAATPSTTGAAAGTTVPPVPPVIP